MNRSLFAAIILLAAVHTAFGQAELVKQKAQHIRDVNNQQQGVISAAGNNPTAPQTATGTPAPAPKMSAEQQALVDRLENDLSIIKPGSAITDQQRTGLQADIASLVKGANPPTKAELAKLSADLTAGLAEKTVNQRDMAQLAKAINIVVNCTPLTPARALAYVTAAQGILKSSGVSDENITAISADLKAIINEIQKSKPKLFQ